MSTEPGEKIMFGPFEVTSQVFLTTPHSFALVNLKPLLPGHVLVCPRRPHARLAGLAPRELADLFVAVQRVQRALARRYFVVPSSSSAPTITTITTTTTNPPASSPRTAADDADGAFTVAVQDGPAAGQTVAHVHVHVIPRVRRGGGGVEEPGGGGGCSAAGDALYRRMAEEEGNVGGALWDRFSREAGRAMGERPRPGGAFEAIEDSQRVERGMAEMEAEAAVYRALLKEEEEEEEGEEGEEGAEQKEKGSV